MVEHNPQSVPDEPTDPFDPELLRSSGIDDIAVEHVTLAVPVRRPNRTEFFRVRPEPEFSVDWFVLERDDDLDREVYWVTPEFRTALLDDLRAVRIFTCINKRGVIFLWPAKLPTPDGNAGRAWAESALVVAEQAKTLWVKMRGDRSLGAYEMFKALGDLGSPQWPDKPLSDLLRLAFKGDRLIDRLDHPVLRELTGEI